MLDAGCGSVILAICVLAGSGVQALSQKTPDAACTGSYTAIFTQRSPLSRQAALSRRFRWRLERGSEDYDLAEERFFVYAPPIDGTEKKHGLLVWISPSPSGVLPKEWRPLMDKHRLIWVGPDHAGNDRSIWQRLGLPLDAVHNMKDRYRIDQTRIYIAGLSGGGRCASRLGITYSDVFRGTLAIVGCDFYRALESTSRPGKFWRPTFRRPKGPILRFARQRSRHVLLTGETDANREQTFVTYEQGYLKDKFQHVHYLEVPDMGHSAPPVEWLDKAIGLMDGEGTERRSDGGGRGRCNTFRGQDAVVVTSGQLVVLSESSEVTCAHKFFKSEIRISTASPAAEAAGEAVEIRASDLRVPRV